MREVDGQYLGAWIWAGGGPHYPRAEPPDSAYEPRALRRERDAIAAANAEIPEAQIVPEQWPCGSGGAFAIHHGDWLFAQSAGT